MIHSIADFRLKKLINYVDWKLLLFLLLFLNVKLAVKIPAIIIIYLLRFNFRFGFSIKNSRLPLFYLLIIAIALSGLFINGNYSNANYMLLFLNGLVFWVLCLLAVHQVKLSVENNTIETVKNTILTFFVINAFVSFFNIALIMWETGAINPYRYQGEYQKYFIGTGDYIKGLTFDTSTTNAVLNAFGVIYSLTLKKPVMVLLCMAVLLLTGSNFINLALLIILAVLFLVNSTKDQKSLIVICVVFLVVFMAKVSPQNNQYAAETFKNIIHPSRPPFPKTAVINATAITKGRPDTIRRKIAHQYLDSIYNASNKNPINNPVKAALPVAKTVQGRIIIAEPDINTKPYQTPTDTVPQQRKLLTFINQHKGKLPISGEASFFPGLPGKALALLQSLKFFQCHPVKIIAGDGMGNFSSKLAFKATSLGFAGKYPARFTYINNDFLTNHLDIYLNFFSKRAELHSLTNSPFSVYDQLFAEYGLLGLLAFAIFYIGFFTKHFKKLTYGLPVLMLMLVAFFIDYWFEQLSVVVFFELLLLLNIKETTSLKAVKYGRA
ncbi:MAG: hypothetical protein JWP44_3528 [Mucilaginibacter sp.]|nr:hypothetical protein [Mucilaginibacter sp.]